MKPFKLLDKIYDKGWSVELSRLHMYKGKWRCRLWDGFPGYKGTTIVEGFGRHWATAIFSAYTQAKIAKSKCPIKVQF